MILPNLDEFIYSQILKRKSSLFQNDLENNKEKLSIAINAKSVLVIGGAGTIGSSFIKAILKYSPKKLIVVDTNENGLTELTRTLRSDSKILMPEIYLTYPMSFASKTFYKLFDEHEGFDIIANFAAHKHVRSEKDHFSIEAMFENNVFTAKDLLDKLSLNPPEHFFCVSTDKAANPVNVMGGSKKLMEQLIMSYSNDFKITTARFANVAFSNGSLLDGYLSRLIQRQPLSCPSDVKRFFVSPEESGQICLLACILGKSGEIFYPKLNESHLINFKDITISFFKYLGLNIDHCDSEIEAKDKALSIQKNSLVTSYPIYFFKTETSGEKLFEEFYENRDELDEVRLEQLGVITNAHIPHKSGVSESIKKLKNAFDSKEVEKSEIIGIMNSIIPGFKHIETGKSLDQKM